MTLNKLLPISFYQVEAGDPLVLDIGYVCKIEIKQLSIHSLISIMTIIEYSIRHIEKLLESSEEIAKTGKIGDNFLKNINNSIYSHYMTLIEMVYSLTENNFKKKKEKKKYKKYLVEMLLLNVNKLHYIINKILEYNTRLKKKLLDLQNFNIWQDESSTTDGEELFNYYVKKSQDQQSIIQASLN